MSARRLQIVLFGVVACSCYGNVSEPARPSPLAFYVPQIAVPRAPQVPKMQTMPEVPQAAPQMETMTEVRGVSEMPLVGEVPFGMLPSTEAQPDGAYVLSQPIAKRPASPLAFLGGLAGGLAAGVALVYSLVKRTGQKVSDGIENLELGALSSVAVESPSMATAEASKLVASGRTSSRHLRAIDTGRGRMRVEVTMSAALDSTLGIDLRGKVAFVAGVADSSGYGWAIVKALSEAGATVAVGTWPPVLGIFEKSLKSGKLDDDLILSNGMKMAVPKIFPLDAMFDTADDVPEDVKNNKRYAGLTGYTIQECADAVKAEYGKCDILVHSLANAPEVKAPLMKVSRKGYLAAASASSYSMVSMVQRFAPFMPKGGSVVALSFLAAERFVAGYGGGMSSAKAQLESDMRVLSFELGRQYGVRINTISAGGLKSRAASAIGGVRGEKTFIEYYIDHSLANAPLQKDLDAEDVGASAAFLCSPLAKAITGVNLYVDNGMAQIAGSVDSKALEGLKYDYDFSMPDSRA